MPEPEQPSHNLAYGIIVALILACVLFALFGLARATKDGETPPPPESVDVVRIMPTATPTPAI